MRISSQNSQFILNLPIDFIRPVLYEKFQILLDNNHMPYDNALDYINSQIKEITFGSMSYDNVEQRIKYGKTMQFKPKINIFDTFQHDLDITFRSVDSDANYFMMMEILTDFYNDTRKMYIPYFTLHILDKSGDLIYTVVFKQILFKSLSEKRFSYQVQDFTEKTFSIIFSYSFLDIIWELRRSPKEQGESIFDLPKDYDERDRGKIGSGEFPFDYRRKYNPFDKNNVR